MSVAPAAEGGLARYQTEVRHLVLRGGPLDGQHWSGVVAVGRRVACGTGPWTAAHVYVVTAEEETGADGARASVAVPAAFP